MRECPLKTRPGPQLPRDQQTTGDEANLEERIVHYIRIIFLEFPRKMSNLFHKVKNIVKRPRQTFFTRFAQNNLNAEIDLYFSSQLFTGGS